jgi:MraZ protein
MGRFIIPKTMIRFAQLDKDVVVVGLGNRVEIWNPQLYENHLIKDQKELSALAEKFLKD